MSKKQYSSSLFIFRRDLRLEDNTGLLEACKQSESVIPCFIFDPRQVRKNPYKGSNAIQFMLESLRDLQASLESRGGRLYCFYGDPTTVVKGLIPKGIEAVFTNRDYTPFSLTRDHDMETQCNRGKIDFHAFHDSLLIEPENALKSDGTPYLVYTPFFKNASKQSVRQPRRNSFRNFSTIEVDGSVRLEEVDILSERNEFLYVNGGRKRGLQLLHGATSLEGYDERRDLPADEGGTSKLSPHHKFGTLSIREVYSALSSSHGTDHTLLRELYWRDFFTHIAVHFPHVFGKSFYSHFDSIQWENDEQKFSVWCEGRTGFPIVDAGMRQLNVTGFMHNRVRMIVASFLTKDLHIDWRWGEKYFATKLVDYDPAVNNGNWQWAASTGCDAQPYFRIFNPWLQQKKFDPDCLYIKKWIPELKDLSSKQIHNLFKDHDLFSAQYPTPVVDHREAKAVAEELYGDVIEASRGLRPN